MNGLYESAISYLTSLDNLELIAVLTGLLYVILAAKARRSCWIAGIISCGIIAWKDVTEYHLFADMFLQLFYVVVGIVGLFRWRNPSPGSQPSSPFIEFDGRKHFIIIGISLGISMMLYTLLSYYTSAALPMLDSLTTVFAVSATVLLLYRVKSNWLYWIVINACYIYIYYARDAIPISFLSFIYLILAIYGYYSWRSFQTEPQTVN